jgi:hypothetical protein
MDSRPCCDYCGEDTVFVLQVAAPVRDRRGYSMFGRWICEDCIDAEGFTGWADTPSGPVRDVLGRACDPAGELPYLHWRVVRPVLAGQPDPPLRPESDLSRLDLGAVVGEIASRLEATL